MPKNGSKIKPRQNTFNLYYNSHRQFGGEQQHFSEANEESDVIPVVFHGPNLQC